MLKLNSVLTIRFKIKKYRYFTQFEFVVRKYIYCYEYGNGVTSFYIKIINKNNGLVYMINE